MPERPVSLSQVWLPAGLRRLPAVISAELPTIALVTAVVALLVLFRKAVFIGMYGVPSAEEFLLSVRGEFVFHYLAALAMLLVIQPVRHKGPQDGMRRVGALAAAVLLAAIVAATARVAYFLFALHAPSEEAWVSWPSYFVRFGLPCALLVTVGEFHRAEVRDLESMRAADADRAVLEQQTLQARVRTLEAQIEPHFLFNTLANLRRLYETDGVAGDAMLERLMAYLAVALPSMRDGQSTLGREARMVESYLELQRVRMGQRLHFAIDIAPTLASVEVPPMMLLTLVENAIKHGLAPQREGGRVDVRASLDGAVLELEVADNGRGFGDDTAGGGTGLANIRARLAAIFGPAADLTLARREPRGLRATIRIPAAMVAA